MRGDCWIGYGLVVHTHVFSNRLVSGGSGAILFYLLPSWDMFRSMVKSETENVVEAES
jgi:hypothetical protein